MHPVRRRETYYMEEFRCGISEFQGNEFSVQFSVLEIIVRLVM